MNEIKKQKKEQENVYLLAKKLAELIGDIDKKRNKELSS